MRDTLLVIFSLDLLGSVTRISGLENVLDLPLDIRQKVWKNICKKSLCEQKKVKNLKVSGGNKKVPIL